MAPSGSIPQDDDTRNQAIRGGGSHLDGFQRRVFTRGSGGDDKMNEKFILRLIELIKEDPELRLALLEAINSYSKAQTALASWRNRRK